MEQDRRRIAAWRFERISPFLDEQLSPAERRRLMESYAKIPVLWPSKREAPVSARSLSRWFATFKKKGDLEALMPPANRKPRDKTPVINSEWVSYALALLEEEPVRSLYVLITRIMIYFCLACGPSRSSLHRALCGQARYKALRRRERGEGGRRRHFQASHPHKIWQADAKGRFIAQMADGTKQEFQVLSIIDDASRYILVARIIKSESLAAAVATFRAAAARWGLPDAFYADRGSCYDAKAFRAGLALLGVRRIDTKAGNAPAHGKIEIYHRSLKRWFVKELKHQPVRDAAHLQALLDAVIEVLYQDHPHRELKRTPREAFNNTYSKRKASLERLNEAFLDARSLATNSNTGNVRIHGVLYRLPDELARKKRVQVFVDPEKTLAPYVMLASKRLQPLEPAWPGHAQATRKTDALEPTGSLTPLLSHYRGRNLPKAHPGFGLPEIYEAFSDALKRSVPQDEIEAQTIVSFARKGPFDPQAFHGALKMTLKQLGPGRPLSTILIALSARIKSNHEHEKRRNKA